MGIFREAWLSIRAAGALVGNFFVRWFLPVHGDEEPEHGLGDRWSFDEEETPRRATAAGADSSAGGDENKDEPLPMSDDDEEMEPEPDMEGDMEVESSSESKPDLITASESEAPLTIPSAPIIAPPQQASERVARGSLSGSGPVAPETNVADEPENALGNARESGEAAPPSSGEISPFIHEKETDQP